MTIRRRFTAVAIAAALLSALVAPAPLLVACNDDPPAPVVCRDIPAGGCPYVVAGCADPSCLALYTCASNATWKLAARCYANDGAAPVPMLDAGDASNDAPSPDADVPGAAGGPGCEDLEAPDCSLAAASSCGHGCCGCDDVFVCQQGGWNLWGSCQGGTIVQTPTR